MGTGFSQKSAREIKEKNRALGPNRNQAHAAQGFGALALGGLALAAIECHHNPAAAGVALVLAALALILFIRIEAGCDAAVVLLPMFAIRECRSAVTATAD